MATNITANFTKQWSNEVHTMFQQKGSKLKMAVRNQPGVVGSTFDFHRVEDVVANQKTRDGDVTALNPDQDTVTATLSDWYAPIYIDKLDEVKTNADFRKPYVEIATSALGRKCDDLIIGALTTTTNGITTTAGGLTYAKLLEAAEVLTAQDVPLEDRFIVVTPAALTTALAEEQLTSADYMTLKNVMTGQIGSAVGFNWIVTTRLAANSETSCFAFNRQSVGLAIGKDITTEINYVPEKVSTLVNSFMSMGSVQVDEQGVVEIEIA